MEQRILTAKRAERSVDDVISVLKSLLETKVNLILNNVKNLTPKVSVKPFQRLAESRGRASGRRSQFSENGETGQSASQGVNFQTVRGTV